MKTLSKIVLINWFRLGAIEVPIVGNTAIVGDNGAGKSALLDAIQTVLTGANKNRLVLNRGSNEQSSRKLWEYVLGVLSDPQNPELSATIKPREKANCYLALNFHDVVSGQTTCVGLCLYASMTEMTDRVEGYFICPELAGSKDLFLEAGEGDRQIVLPWPRVRERLGRECPETRFPVAPGKFTSDLYHYLSENPATPNNPDTVLKALQAAFRLEKISDPTEFIRKYMLDRDDLQIKELQAELKNYRDMAEKTASISRRIEELGKLEKECVRVEEARARKALAEWVSVNARIETGEEKANPLRERLGDLSDEIDDLSDCKKELTDTRSNLQGDYGITLGRLEGLDSTVQRNRLNNEIEKIEARLQEVSAQIASHRRLLQKVGSTRTAIPAGLNEAVADLASCLPGDNMLETETWPQNPALIDACILAIREHLTLALPVLKTRYDAECAKISSEEGRLKELQDGITLLKNNQSPVSSQTRGLIRFYREHGIEARPLCDVVEVNDKEWRNTIEGVLGNVREALLVHSDLAKRAVQLYRREARRDFPYRHVVNTTQTDRWIDRCQSGSLAECVSTDDRDARAFINRRIGDILKVETEKDLLKHDRTATADLMIGTGGTITEIRPVSPIMGRRDRPELLESYQKEALALSNRISSELEPPRRALGNLITVLEEFQNTFPGDNTSPMVELLQRREIETGKAENFRKELAALENNALEKKLRGELDSLKTGIDEATKKIEEKEKSLLEAQRLQIETEKDLQSLEVQIDALQKVAQEMANNLWLDRVKGAETLDRWRDEVGDLGKICDRADREAQTASRTIAETIQKKIVPGYTEYLLRHAGDEGEEAPPEEFDDYATVIRRKRSRLIGTSLAEYEEKTRRALEGAEDAFRSKFVSRLIGKLDAVRSMIFHLNKSLEKHPFHGEIYKFRHAANPDFKHIIDFARVCGSDPAKEAGSLFDPAGEPNSPHRKALDDISEALQDPAKAERLQDYRNFLVFDVEMFNTAGEQTADLRHRIQKGSGGENQTPFYVAIGASLAAAYRIREGFGGEVHGGMCLAVFDEAFSKLSVATCHACIDFLKNIHLQLVVAAPDDKFSVMAEVMDTIIWVTRDGGVVEVDPVFIKPSMRSLLRSDNPYRKAVNPDRNLLVSAEAVHE